MKSPDLKRRESPPDSVYTKEEHANPVVRQKSNDFAWMALKYILQLLKKQVMQTTARSTLWQTMRPQKNTLTTPSDCYWWLRELLEGCPCLRKMALSRKCTDTSQSGQRGKPSELFKHSFGNVTNCNAKKYDLRSYNVTHQKPVPLRHLHKHIRHFSAGKPLCFLAQHYHFDAVYW